jgi:hypothetical protein
VVLKVGEKGVNSMSTGRIQQEWERYMERGFLSGGIGGLDKGARIWTTKESVLRTGAKGSVLRTGAKYTKVIFPRTGTTGGGSRRDALDRGSRV